MSNIPTKNRTLKGFTLIEVLIIISILALLMVALLLSVKNQRQKAEDARIKADLDRLKIAFEDYYNDNNCYPPTSWFDTADDCGSNLLQPYLNAIPCDPKSDLPYPLEHVGNQCSGFRLFGTLENYSDPAVTDLCVGSGGSSLGNYGVSSSNTTVGINCAPQSSGGGSPTPNPSSPFPPGQYACQTLDPINGCNNFGSQANALANGCPATFSDASCNGQCGNPIYKCP